MRTLRAFAVAAGCASTVLALGAPVSNTELSEVCAQAEDPAHCGRLVEAVQLKRLPNLARREGNVLSVSLYPSGSTNFTDSDDVVNGRSYSLWDYLDGINAVVIYTTAGDNVTADICEARCTNEVVVWGVTREGIRKELVWSPGAAWTDAVAKWKDTATLSFEYAGPEGTGTAERKLDDPGWKRVP